MPQPLPPLSPNAPILARLRPQLPALAAAAFHNSMDSAPEGSAISAEHFADDVIPLMIEAASLFLQALHEQRPLTPADLSIIEALVTQLAEDRIPVSALIAVHIGAMQAFWSAVSAAAQPEDTADLAAIGSHMLAVMQLIATVAVDTYTEVQESVFGAEREARRSLCSALLHGEPAAGLASRAGVTLPAEYDILTIVADHDQSAVGPEETLLRRRRVRWTQEILDEAAGAPVLNSFDGVSGTALFPAGTRIATALVQGMSGRFGADVFAAQRNSVRIAAIPDAAKECREVADLARLLGRPSGIHHLADMLLEYQITRPGPARDQILELLAPVLEQPHLMEALDTHMRHGLDRKSAAAELHIHPNTLSYRLRRISALTNIDPTDPNGSRLLAAALTITRFLAPDNRSASG